MKAIPPVLVIATLMLVSCGKPSNQAPSQKDLVGKWTLKELETGKGHRGPAEGIFTGEMQLNADGSCSNWMQASRQATGKEQPIMSFSGSWSLSNNVFKWNTGTNAPISSRVSFDGKLLALIPEAPQHGQPQLIFYYSKSE